MATFAAFKLLGQSIAADIADAKDSLKRSIERKARERRIVNEFKELLTEDPALVAQAFKSLADKPVRKPRAPKAV